MVNHINFVSPIQNWKYLWNPGLKYFSDYFFNYEEIDQQLYAERMGW